MSEQFIRSRGRSQNFKLDRGGVAADFGPFYGIVKNTTDILRSGRIQVYIPVFGDGFENDPEKWITISYAPPFFGSTPYNPAKEGFGSYIDGNSNSYGMWFTPPDIGITVLVVFVNGDRSQGYYIGVVPDQSIGHMVPAVGASASYVPENTSQAEYFKNALRLPVVEINTNNLGLEQSSRFFDKPKPIQAVVAQTMFRQGLITDLERGPISSSSQRESPSGVFGFSTPGTPVYQGGQRPRDITEKLQTGQVRAGDLNVIGRTGGHSMVFDDGDQSGLNKLIRIRTSGGHQITMNDSGSFFYIVHANGLAWIELGKEGTLDVYAANSVNIRTQGDINLHADRDINMFAGRNFKLKSEGDMKIQSQAAMTLISAGNLDIYSKAVLRVKSNGQLTLDSNTGSWQARSTFVLSAPGGIDMNGPSAPAVDAPTDIEITKLTSTEFDTSLGWVTVDQGLQSIVPRAPTHEPYPYHNQGVDVKIDLEPGDPSPPPGAVPMPPNTEIVRTA